MADLPTGVTVLSNSGDGPAPIERVLAACEPETDPEREGIRILLACVWSIAPRAELAGFVVHACRLIPHLAALDPTLITDVARRMDLGL